MFSKKTVFKNISLVIFSNTVIIVTSIIFTVIIPKFLGVLGFSYWQLYIFYLTYIIYLQLGWLEGIYLKEGGKEYKELNFSRYNFQLKTIILFSISISSLIYTISRSLLSDANKSKVVGYVCIYFVIVSIRTFFSYIYQATGKINIYVIMNIVERTAFLVGCAVLLWLHVDNYEKLIHLDLLCRALATFIAAIYGKELRFNHSIVSKRDEYAEILDNVRVGSKLMLAAATGLLVNGVVRAFIEHHWDVETFGRVSLSISLPNFVITFASAVSVVFFPMLKRITDGIKQRELHRYLDISIQILTLGALCFYYPIKLILILWLPEYKTSIDYLAIIFPICYFESKMSVVNITFLKAFREEKTIFVVNLISLAVSLGLSIIFIDLMNNLILGIFVIVISSIVKCCISSLFLWHRYQMGSPVEELLPVFFAIIFVAMNRKIGGETSFWIYLWVFIIYCVCKRKEIRHCIMFIISK